MNITSSAGACGSSSTSNCKRWLISTQSATIITNNAASNLFSVTEDTTSHTNISGIRFIQGTGTGVDIFLNFASGGRAVLIHDCWFEQNNGPNVIDGTTNRGVVWNSSFDASPFLIVAGAFRVKGAPASSWTTASTMGSADTTGENNFYVENNDFHAYLGVSDFDDNARVVWRYNLMDNAAFGSHGADTSTYGLRHFEIYNNVGLFNGYSDGTTFNMGNGWMFIRGGTFIVFNNNFPAMVSTDLGTKPDIKMTVMNLQRNAGPNPCWGLGTANGADYHVPRQIGYGFVTGTGKDGLGRTNDSITYVGDSEPVYIWGNSRQPLSVSISDYGTGITNSCTGTVETSTNYLIAGRDYFNGTTPKPGWSPYTYPHPLTQGASSPPPPPPSAPAAPTSLTTTVK